MAINVSRMVTICCVSFYPLHTAARLKLPRLLYRTPGQIIISLLIFIRLVRWVQQITNTNKPTRRFRLRVILICFGYAFERVSTMPFSNILTSSHTIIHQTRPLESVTRQSNQAGEKGVTCGGEYDNVWKLCDIFFPRLRRTRHTCQWIFFSLRYFHKCLPSLRDW